MKLRAKKKISFFGLSSISKETRPNKTRSKLKKKKKRSFQFNEHKITTESPRPHSNGGNYQRSLAAPKPSGDPNHWINRFWHQIIRFGVTSGHLKVGPTRSGRASHLTSSWKAPTPIPNQGGNQ